MTESQYDSTVFILSWDMYGLESCINASEIDRQYILDTLSDKKTTVSSNLNHVLSTLTLRARFNSQRHYEIYSIVVDASITEEDLVKQFDENPQAMAELIRSRGNKIYSDRVENNKVLIR